MEVTKSMGTIREEEVIELLADLVSIPSYSGINNQEKKVAVKIHQIFRKEGIQAEMIEVEKGRYNVVATLKGNGKGKTLLLNGHTDTVPPYDMKNPFELIEKDEKLYGRGVVDMKGPLVCMIFAMIALKRAEIQLSGDVIFAGVIDEEEGSLGTIDLIEKRIQADVAIVGEPTNLDLCVAHRGLEWFEVHFQGKTVHGGKQSEGINAIQKAGNFIHRCEEELIPKIQQETHDIIGTSTMNYGTIQGGTQPSTVAGECILKLDRRWVPGVRYKDIVDDYENLIKDLKKEDSEFRCTMNVVKESIMKEGYVHEAMEIHQHHPILQIVKETTKEILGKKCEVTFFPAWTDGGLLNHYAGIPSIIFGPGNLKSAHSENEFIEKNQLIPAVHIYTKIAMKFCK